MADRRMSAGERDRPVTIQKLVESTGASGFPVESWVPLCHVLASRQELTGRERMMANQLAAAHDTTWQIPYRADMDPEIEDVPKKRRVIARGRVHDIVSARVVGSYDLVEIATIASTKARHP